MPGSQPCQTWWVSSCRCTRRSGPSGSNRQSSTACAAADQSAKLVPAPSQCAPSGVGEPGLVSSGRPVVITVILPRGGPGRAADGASRAGWMSDVSSQPAPFGAVVQMSGVDVVRGQAYLLRGIDWAVEPDHRWVILGPNGAGKTTLLQLAAALMHPTQGTVRLLGETMGAVDVFELRPRIGITSAALAQRIEPRERTGDVVVSAGYAVVGRWRERYDVHDLTRAAMLMQQWGVTPVAHRPFGTLSEG